MATIQGSSGNDTITLAGNSGGGSVPSGGFDVIDYSALSGALVVTIASNLSATAVKSGLGTDHLSGFVSTVPTVPSGPDR